MAEPFIGEIKFFSFDWPPKNWLLCDGRLLAINQYQTLFSLLGTEFGGNGTTNFALPDLRGRVPMHADGATPRGRMGGAEYVTLLANELPQHNHLVAASSAVGTVKLYEGALFAVPSGNDSKIYAAPGVTQALSSSTVSSAGGSQSHINIQPSLVGNYCIAINGLYPSRS